MKKLWCSRLAGGVTAPLPVGVDIRKRRKIPRTPEKAKQLCAYIFYWLLICNCKLSGAFLLFLFVLNFKADNNHGRHSETSQQAQGPSCKATAGADSISSSIYLFIYLLLFGV